jgi:C-terminal domain of 1-Cys peroxiredoxin
MASRTAVDSATIRSVFVIGPDKKIKMMMTYPMSTRRNFDEVLRVLDSIQLTAKQKVATPVNWKQGKTSLSSLRFLMTKPSKYSQAVGKRRNRICGSCRNLNAFLQPVERGAKGASFFHPLKRFASAAESSSRNKAGLLSAPSTRSVSGR